MFIRRKPSYQTSQGPHAPILGLLPHLHERVVAGSLACRQGLRIADRIPRRIFNPALKTFELYRQLLSVYNGNVLTVF